MMTMNISKENLDKIKKEIFEKEINNQEKEEIIKKIDQEIEELLSKINEESEPIDE